MTGTKVAVVAIDEIGYDREFAAAQPDAPTLPIGPVGFEVEGQITMTDERGWLFRRRLPRRDLGTGQIELDPFEQDGETSRLLHEVDGAADQGGFFVYLIRQRGQEDHRHLDAAFAQPEQPAALVGHGDLTLDLETNRADWKGRRVGLSRSEFFIVSYLANRNGRDVGYRELYDLVRGGGFAAGAGPEGYRANVHTFIRRIRAKFRDIDDGFQEIENFPGFGYRWRGLEE